MDEHIASILDAAEHPALRRMITLWNDKRVGRMFPKRADFDPIEMKFALGDISLFDVEEEPRRFWCRLDGTRQVELFGVDCTNHYLDQCFSAEFYKVAHAGLSATVDDRRPRYHQRQVPYQGRVIRYEVVMLPLSEMGEKVDKLMSVLTPHWE